MFIPTGLCYSQLLREASCRSRKQSIVTCITGKNGKEKRHKHDISINHNHHHSLRNAMEENTERMWEMKDGKNYQEVLSCGHDMVAALMATVFYLQMTCTRSRQLNYGIDEIVNVHTQTHSEELHLCNYF